MRSMASSCIAASVRTTGSTFFSGRGALLASKTNEKLFVSVLSRRPGFQTAAVTSTQTRPWSQTWTTWLFKASSAPTCVTEGLDGVGRRES